MYSLGAIKYHCNSKYLQLYNTLFMKNLQKLFSMTMLVCMAVAMFSCSKDDEENLDVEVGIVGEWKIESTEMLINGQSYDAYIEQAAKQAGMDVEAFQEFFGEAFEVEGDFRFMEDKKFDGEVEGETIEGVWSADGKKLVLEYEEDGEQESEEFIVKSLDSSSAVLSSTEVEEEGGVKIEIESILRLKKQ